MAVKTYLEIKKITNDNEDCFNRSRFFPRQENNKSHERKREKNVGIQKAPRIEEVIGGIQSKINRIMYGLDLYSICIGCERIRGKWLCMSLLQSRRI